MLQIAAVEHLASIAVNHLVADRRLEVCFVLFDPFEQIVRRRVRFRVDGRRCLRCAAAVALGVCAVMRIDRCHLQCRRKT